MGLRHKVCVNVTHEDGSKKPVIRSGTKQFPKRLLNLIFGETVGVLVITPGDTVETVEIREIGKGVFKDEQNETTVGCHI